MGRDPFEVLGIARDATLDQAKDAYRRTVELFHPDRLRGLRESVRAEGERRLREATQAMHAVERALAGPLRAPGHEVATASPLSPSDGATEAEARMYDAVLREVDDQGIALPGAKAAFGGDGARAVLAKLRHEFRRGEGPIRMLDWGSYRVELPGAELLVFLQKALGIDVDEADDRPALGERLPAVAERAAVPAELNDALVHIRRDVVYALTADVY